jgi:iron complex outermembrane receptor protein
MQLSVFNAQNASAGKLDNLPTATIKGLEASAQTQLGQLGFTLSAAYTDSAMGTLSAIPNYKFPSGFGVTSQCAPGQTTACTDYSNFYETLSGEQTPFAPKLTLQSTIDYAIRIGCGALTPRLNFSHTDKQYGCIFQTDNSCEMGARNLWGANLDYALGPWQAWVYGTNLTNKTYISSNNGQSYVFYGPPRQYGMQVRFRF